MDCPGQNTRNFGHQKFSDSGKTHCNWVSPHLQLYFQGLAGKQGKGAVLSPAPDSATEFMQTICASHQNVAEASKDGLIVNIE